MTETIRTISHEWRQPLNSISILAQKLSLNLEDDKDSFMTLEKIKNSINSLSNTIEEFKSLVEFKGQKERVNIRQLIETLIKPYKNMTEFNLDIDSNINVEIYENRVVNIFNNIIQNSIESMQKNSIKNGMIQISIKNSSNSLVIEIADNAGGIDNSIINRVFEPYFSTKDQTAWSRTWLIYL